MKYFARSSRASAGAAAAVLLFIVYALTLAPDVTFWDAGEFIAAAHSLGIPHPPGTPLYILLVNAWGKLLFFPPYAVATNLFSAVVTAFAAGISAQLVARATSNRFMAFAAAVAAGGMSSVWLNATETEVYAVSLALGISMVWAGDRAGRVAAGGERWTLLTAYLIALAVPLHLSALVAAPPAIALAALAPDGIRLRRALTLSGTLLLAMGVGRMSGWLCVVGAVVILLALGPVPAVQRRWPSGGGRSPLGGESSQRWSAGTEVPPADSRGLSIATLAVALVAMSAILFLYVRAAFDPAINQGNPDTLEALVDAVARRQYAVSPPWPRQAPAWVQLGNLGQYADLQIALSTGPTVLPSVLRTLATFLFLYLGYLGAVIHWKKDRRTWIGVLGLLVCGTLGVVVYLNLHAGPSIGYGILPANVVREARERDYFFVFGFWAWGMWAGIGAIALVQRWSRPEWTGVLIALLPILLNWRAVTRRGEPEQSLPRQLALALLESAPRNAVLFAMGDNDSYPLWYAQQVLRVRPDVSVVTIPLLPTRWYRDEVARRHRLLSETDVDRFDAKLTTAAAIADGARRAGRPVAAAATLTPGERKKIARHWVARGVVYVEGDGLSPIDSVAAQHWASWVDQRVPKRDTRPAIDPAHSYYRRVLDCPRQFAAAARTREETPLDSACNYR